jgi:tRNA A37 N6-isopentenylltransferase MiaA
MTCGPASGIWMTDRIDCKESDQVDSRHYAKRQFTWARHELKGFEWIAPEATEEAGEKSLR